MIRKARIATMKVVSEYWKETAIALFSLIGSFMIFYFTIGKDVVTHDEVVYMLKTQAPYVSDKKLINEKLDRADETNKKLSEAIQNLSIEIARMRAINEMILGKRENGE